MKSFLTLLAVLPWASASASAIILPDDRATEIDTSTPKSHEIAGPAYEELGKKNKSMEKSVDTENGNTKGDIQGGSDEKPYRSLEHDGRIN
ncbi:hypothetical protein DL771_003104 [Monosporascus sp. 5C6A]|nr:hypothetical protein DL771_003104 [Monosporascus sp. 5C6A]